LNSSIGLSAFRASAPRQEAGELLGPLAELPGAWVGSGFNLISLPDKEGGNIFRLMLNATVETLTFNPVGGPVPNRGSAQDDIFLHGVHYLQQVSDASTFSALHIEPGLWLNVPPTSAPEQPQTIVRLSTIPHGDSVLAQGTEFASHPGGPRIEPVSSRPFPVNDPHGQMPFGYLDPFQNTPLPAGIPEGAITDPNIVLTDTLAKQAKNGLEVVETTVFKVSTENLGAIVNIPFVTVNANATKLDATFWIEKVAQPNAPAFLQLQYTQTVMLEFDGVVWPHISVATLTKQ
jgi:hypothetical protein